MAPFDRLCILRTEDESDIPSTIIISALAVAASGMRLIEITWNSEKAVDLITKLRCELPDCIIGTGTVLNLQDLHSAIDCGAQYIFTPHVDAELIQAGTIDFYKLNFQLYLVNMCGRYYQRVHDFLTE